MHFAINEKTDIEQGGTIAHFAFKKRLAYDCTMLCYYPITNQCHVAKIMRARGTQRTRRVAIGRTLLKPVSGPRTGEHCGAALQQLPYSLVTTPSPASPLRRHSVATPSPLRRHPVARLCSFTPLHRR